MKIKKYIKDIVYGANDGIVTTFAVISGGYGAGLSVRTIVIIGVVALFADSISMAGSNYLGTKSQNSISVIKRSQNPVISSMFTLISFIIAGFMPLLPYIIHIEPIFHYSILSTFLALLVIGSARTYVTGRNPVVGAIEMLVIGGTASLVAYFVGIFINTLV
jgi:vacuolar iron transporter family protein